MSTCLHAPFGGVPHCRCDPTCECRIAGQCPCTTGDAIPLSALGTPPPPAQLPIHASAPIVCGTEAASAKRERTPQEVEALLLLAQLGGGLATLAASALRHGLNCEIVAGTPLLDELTDAIGQLRVVVDVAIGHGVLPLKDILQGRADYIATQQWDSPLWSRGVIEHLRQRVR